MALSENISSSSSIHNLPKLYKHIGIVTGIADGIVHCIGMSDVGYMKQ